MFSYQFSKIERYWLLGIRLLWQYRGHGRAVTRLVNRLLAQAGLEPRGRDLAALLVTLEAQGADHLYIEQFDQPGLTGDERDILTALRACFLDDPLGAEAALSALLPPGHTEAVIACAQRVAASSSESNEIARDAIQHPFFPAACH